MEKERSMQIYRVYIFIVYGVRILMEMSMFSDTLFGAGVRSQQVSERVNELAKETGVSSGVTDQANMGDSE